MTKLSVLQSKWLKDSKVKKEHEAMEPEFMIATKLIKARLKSKLTQKEVADKMGTTQSVVARLESGTSLPSLKTIFKYAEATGQKIQLQIQ